MCHHNVKIVNKIMCQGKIFYIQVLVKRSFGSRVGPFDVRGSFSSSSDISDLKQARVAIWEDDL